MSIKRSIATEYQGITFRSKLEADWARTFDTLGVRWEYEPRGRYFGDQFYLVDFWLPASRQWVEVKGVFEPNDVRKIRALLAHVGPRPFTDDTCPDIAIVACEPNGVFRGWERTTEGDLEPWFDFLTKRAREVELFACVKCRGFWFADAAASWRCQCCGASDGNGHLATMVSSPVPEFGNINALHFLTPGGR